MKTEQFTIITKEIPVFIESCNDVKGINVIDAHQNIITVSYNDPSNLFYLGQMFVLNKQLKPA